MDKKNQTAGSPQISRILVPTDFSDQSSQALDWAQSLADAFGAQLVLLYVIDILIWLRPAV